MKLGTLHLPCNRVLYDGQCEICQLYVSRLNALDHENKIVFRNIDVAGRSF
jgi:predicted DCC family thiol-disulfide oxidoreductase YuxK